MQINMNDSRIININQIRKLLEGTKGLDLSLRDGSIEEKYCFIDQTIDRVLYWKLKKKEKRVVINYLKKLTSYKQTQLYRLVSRASKGELKRKEYKRSNPNRKYSSFDIKLLEKTDELHKRLSGIATKEILRREYEVFGHKDYQNIAQISPSHINNLRSSPIYKNSWVNHTKSRQVPIGITQPPENYGNPGSLRVDTVHQRAIYHINSVDEITQFEIVVCVPEVCERYLEPALEVLLEQYPFLVFNFHSDRGSEYINRVVSQLLNKLLIQQTKNRSYHSHDNALVETKNAAVIRKNMGWQYISQGLTGKINAYYQKHFNSYLNFHRPCVYATRVIVSPNGRERRTYDQTMTPYDKLKEVSRLKRKNFLKPGITFDKLDIIAYEMSDNEFAEQMRKEETKLFTLIMEVQQQRSSYCKFRP